MSGGEVKAYRAVFERDEDGSWLVELPDVQGCRSYGRSLEEARRNIREALSTCVDVFASDEAADAAAAAAVLEEEIRLPAGVRKAVDRARAGREQAETAAAAAAEATRAAARALTEQGVSLRDAGELLGLSHGRIRQVLEGKRTALGRRRARMHSTGSWSA